MAGNKGKGGKGNGSTNDQRGGMAKAQEAARKGGQDTATGGAAAKSGSDARGGKAGGKS